MFIPDKNDYNTKLYKNQLLAIKYIYTCLYICSKCVMFGHIPEEITIQKARSIVPSSLSSKTSPLIAACK